MIGLPFVGTEAKIVDLETGTDVAKAGDIGELAIKGPQVMQGYWNHPEETAMVLKDGWLYTGDIGYMDADGFFAIVDRKKDMIKVGGENVYPRDVEEVLFKNPKVMDCVVAGIPDADGRQHLVDQAFLTGPAYLDPVWHTDANDHGPLGLPDNLHFEFGLDQLSFAERKLEGFDLVEAVGVLDRQAPPVATLPQALGHPHAADAKYIVVR